MNYIISPGYPWVLCVALMGRCLAVHGLQAFDKVPLVTAARERRQVEKYMGRKLQMFCRMSADSSPVSHCNESDAANVQ